MGVRATRERLPGNCPLGFWNTGQLSASAFLSNILMFVGPNNRRLKLEQATRVAEAESGNIPTTAHLFDPFVTTQGSKRSPDLLQRDECHCRIIIRLRGIKPLSQ